MVMLHILGEVLYLLFKFFTFQTIFAPFYLIFVPFLQAVYHFNRVGPQNMKLVLHDILENTKYEI